MNKPASHEYLLHRGVALALSAGLTWSLLGSVVTGFQAPPASTVRWVELPRVVVVARREAPVPADTKADATGLSQPAQAQGKLTQLKDLSLRSAL